MKRVPKFKSLRNLRRRMVLTLAKLQILLAQNRHKSELQDQLRACGTRSSLLDAQLLELSARLDRELARLRKLQDQERLLRAAGIGRPSNVERPKRRGRRR